jgi:hypothetical protein
VSWWDGPINAIDRCLIEWGLRDWWEIDEALKGTVPTWLIRERIAAFHAQRSVK